MASVEIHPDRLVIRLSAAEKALSLRRRDIVLDRKAISSALITDDPWVWLRGVRSPGTMLPRSLALGTWRALGGRDFVLARSKRPAVVIDFNTAADNTDASSTEASSTEASTDANNGDLNVQREDFDDFARVVLSTKHAAELIRVLRGDDSTAVFQAGA